MHIFKAIIDFILGLLGYRRSSKKQMIIVPGTPQVVTVGEEESVTLTVRAMELKNDSSKQPLRDFSVIFKVTSNLGEFQGAFSNNLKQIQLNTDANGEISAVLKLANEPITYTIEASASGLQSVIFTVTVAEPTPPELLPSLSDTQETGLIQKADLIEIAGRVAQIFSVPPLLVKAIIQQESNFRPSLMEHDDGLMQTIEKWVRKPLFERTDPVLTAKQANDLVQLANLAELTEAVYKPINEVFRGKQGTSRQRAAVQIGFGTLYLKRLIEYFGRIPLAVVAYNGGWPKILEIVKAYPSRDDAANAYKKHYIELELLPTQSAHDNYGGFDWNKRPVKDPGTGVILKSYQYCRQAGPDTREGVLDRMIDAQWCQEVGEEPLNLSWF